MNKLNENELEKKIREGYNKSRLLRGFVERGYKNKIRWKKGKNTNANWTKMTKRVFEEIGEEKEFKIVETDKEKKNKEFMALDQVWFNKEKDDVAVLALETENRAKFEEIVKDEFRKLLNFKSDYKILIWYNYDDDDEGKFLDEFQKKVNVHPKVLKNEVFFIIKLWRNEKGIGLTICKLKKHEKRKDVKQWLVYDMYKRKAKAKELKNEIEA